MLDLLARVEPEFQERVRNNIILSGGGGLIRGLPEALEDALRGVGGGKVRFMDDPVFIGSDGGLALAHGRAGRGLGEADGVRAGCRVSESQRLRERDNLTLSL